VAGKYESKTIPSAQETPTISLNRTPIAISPLSQSGHVQSPWPGHGPALQRAIVPEATGIGLAPREFCNISPEVKTTAAADTVSLSAAACNRRVQRSLDQCLKKTRFAKLPRSSTDFPTHKARLIEARVPWRGA
jgi:hypothetical protein